MSTDVNDLMSKNAMTATPHQTAGHLRKVMSDHHISCMPVTSPEGEAVGIVTANDLIAQSTDGTPISQFMTRKVYTIPQYAKTSLAARIMRNHHIHHLVVTHEQKIVGVVSSFDLLKLVEDHRFVMKNASTPTKHKNGQRQKAES